MAKEKKSEGMEPQDLIKSLEQMDWPPKIQFGEDSPVSTLNELDVSWVFCTILGMKWAAAQAVDNIIERKFLYSKAMMLADELHMNRMALDEERQRLQKELDEKIKSIGATPPPVQPDPASLVGESQVLPDVLEQTPKEAYGLNL